MKHPKKPRKGDCKEPDVQTLDEGTGPPPPPPPPPQDEGPLGGG